MTVTFGSTTFDKVAFDRDADVLYLNVEGCQPAHWDESPEGHALRFDAAGQLCGLTIVGVSHHLAEDGSVPVTIPTRTELGLRDLDLALA